MSLLTQFYNCDSGGGGGVDVLAAQGGIGECTAWIMGNNSADTAVTLEGWSPSVYSGTVISYGTWRGTGVIGAKNPGATGGFGGVGSPPPTGLWINGSTFSNTMGIIPILWPAATNATELYITNSVISPGYRLQGGAGVLLEKVYLETVLGLAGSQVGARLCPNLTDLTVKFGYNPNVNTLTTNYSFDGNALSQASVDGILVGMANAEWVGTGTINLTGGTNATPSATGLAAKTTLQGRGYTVTHN